MPLIDGNSAAGSSHVATSPARPAPARHRGFSLIELLAVIAIIALVTTLGVSAFRNQGQSNSVSTAAATVSSAVSGARQLAITKNCRTRFFIVTDASSDSDWNLRRYGVLRVPEDTTDVDDNGNIAFELASRMDELPSGIYFRDNEHSSDDAQTGGTSMFSSPAHINIGQKNFRYAYIEFLPSGGTTEASTSNIFEIVRAPSEKDDIPDNKNYIRIGVAQSTGRVKFERPDL